MDEGCVINRKQCGPRPEGCGRWKPSTGVRNSDWPAPSLFHPAPLQQGLEPGNGLVSLSPAGGPQAGTQEPVDVRLPALCFPKEHPRGLIRGNNGPQSVLMTLRGPAWGLCPRCALAVISRALGALA